MEANFYSESELLAWVMILFLRTLLLLLRLCSTSFLRLEWLDSTGWVVNWLACSASGWDILLLRFLLLLCSTSCLRLEWLDSTGWVVSWLACSVSPSGWDILLLRFLLLSSRPLVTESPSAKGKSQL